MKIYFLIHYFFKINQTFLDKISRKYPSDWRKLASLSLIEEGDHKSIRMANLVIQFIVECI